MLTNVDKKSEKIRKIFHCKYCDYTTSDKKDYNKHLLTAKHKRLTNVDKKMHDTNKLLNLSILQKLLISLIS